MCEFERLLIIESLAQIIFSERIESPESVPAPPPPSPPLASKGFFQTRHKHGNLCPVWCAGLAVQL